MAPLPAPPGKYFITFCLVRIINGTQTDRCTLYTTTICTQICIVEVVGIQLTCPTKWKDCCNTRLPLLSELAPASVGDPCTTIETTSLHNTFLNSMNLCMNSKRQAMQMQTGSGICTNNEQAMLIIHMYTVVMVICYNAADIIYMYTVVMATCCNTVYIIHTHAAVMVDCHNAAGINL